MRTFIPTALGLLLQGCVLSHSTPEPVPPPPVTAVLVNALGVFSGLARVPPATALEDLSAAANRADSQERPVVDALLPLLSREVEEPQSVAAADLQRVAELMDTVAGQHPTEFGVQLAMVEGADNVEAAARERTPRSLAEDRPSPAARRRAQRLAARFPSEARAFAHLGRVEAAAGGDPLAALRSFGRCLQLDPGANHCKRDFDVQAERYARPRCTAFRTDGFALYQARDATQGGGKTRGMRPLAIQGRRLLVESTPAFTGKDINDLVETSDGLTVYLMPASAARFAELTGQLAKRGGYLVIALDGKPISAPQVMSEIGSGTLQIAGQRLGQSRLCAAVERRSLPPDLAVYAK